MWKLFSRKHNYHLTARENEVLKLVAKGRLNREIATELGISEQMVKNRLTTIFLKLGVKNRTQAALKFSKIDKKPSL